MEEPPHYFGKPPKSYDVVLAFLGKLPRRAAELARFAWSAAGTWSTAGVRVARLRAERVRIGREQHRLQHELGGAAFENDVLRMEQLRGALFDCVARRDDCTRRSRAALGRARVRTRNERVAVATTQVREPGA
jgi:hypothetical protein